MTLSEWASKNFSLQSDSSAEPGRYSYDRAPFQKDMLDACANPIYEQVVFCTGAQVGKTTLQLATLLYYIHTDPGPILFVYPTKEIAASFSKDRLTPAIEDNKCVKDLVADNKAKVTTNTISSKSFRGGVVNLVGANSPANLSSRPVRILLCDEVDRFPLTSGNEGDPLQLAMKRTTTFFDRKMIFVSTPTDKLTSKIWKKYQDSDQRKYEVKCIHCDEYFVPVFATHVKWVKDAAGNHLPHSALLHCPHCSCGHDDTQRQRAVRKGRWVITKPESKIAGFHLSSLISPWIKLGDLAEKFLAAKGDIALLKTFINTELGEPWEEQSENLDNIEFLNRLEGYTPDNLPTGIELITAGVDCQADRLECSIYGYGIENEIWHIQHSVIHGSPTAVGTWNELASYLQKKFKRDDGVPLKIEAACVDSGYSTNAVYNFCKFNQQRRWFATKGRQGALPIFPQRATQNKEGGKLYILGVDTAKEQLQTQLKLKEKGAGYVHFSEDCDQDFFHQLTAERKVLNNKNGHAFYTWKLPSGRRNEVFDCAVYALAAKEALTQNISVKLIKNKRNRKLEANKQADIKADIKTVTPSDVLNNTNTNSTTATEPAEKEKLNTESANKALPKWKQNLNKANLNRVIRKF
jgi:phage terminase large subunit GpA-like protein